MDWGSFDFSFGCPEVSDADGNSVTTTVTIYAVIFVLVLSGLIQFLPRRLALMQRRAMYYLFGQEGYRDDLGFWNETAVSVAREVYNEP